MTDNRNPLDRFFAWMPPTPAPIISVVRVRDTLIVTTEDAVYRVRSDGEFAGDFCVEKVHWL